VVDELIRRANTVSMKTALGILMLVAASAAQATSVARIELPELVKRTDHVLLATVAKVDMIDGNGHEVTDSDAGTGPGSDNQIRFHLDVHEVIYSTSLRPPRRVIVRLWKMWHYSLGGIRENVEGSKGIFMLAGENFDPAYPKSFQLSPDSRRQIEELLVSQGKVKSTR
jgi:hypothetical protein